ncbi:MAG TPA: hypothetical protein VMI56_17775 [Reyranella sp.]|nr:hypothetical protein [Reyranella sp.]
MRFEIAATVGVIVAALAITGCDNINSLPTPLYSLIKTPASYRTDNGVRIDNAGVPLDAQGYRVDKQGRRLDVVDVEAKTASQTSNPMAGFYISGTGKTAEGSVMAPSEGAREGAGYGPGSATIAPGAMVAPVPTTPAVTVPALPGTTPPTPLTR